MQLDHLVINTALGMDAAAALFADLGFHLTPRGHHSLGSINHLMMNPASYLELVGVPATGKQRQEVLDSPLGLSGLVFRSGGAEATYKRLSAAGFAPQEPILLERPVMLVQGEDIARFHNVRMTAAEFPAGRVYFCQHLTPDLVWREEWLGHPNGFCGISGMSVHDPDPERAAARYAALSGGQAMLNGAGAGGGWCIEQGGFALCIVQGASAFASATLVFGDLDDITIRAEASRHAEWRGDGVGGILTIPLLALTLKCRAK